MKRLKKYETEESAINIPSTKRLYEDLSPVTE